jgi:sterol desaturase/sphingolipid hydroxylase (fatty acid hydroxylase superfamily)
MPHAEVSRSKEPIRLFKSDFLEFFSHIHPAVVLAIWTPVAGYFLARAILTRPAGMSAVYIPLAFAAGLFFWTFAEYVLHRFLFHFRPRGPLQERISFLFHGVHHAQPMSKTRLVMPPAVSIPMAAVMYGLFHLVLAVVFGAAHLVAPAFAGFIAGYLCYDMLHYSMHHINLKSCYLKYIRSHHMRHHGQTPNQRYGVSSPLWDWVFGTEPK